MRHPPISFDEGPPPSPWERERERLRNLVDGLVHDELAVLHLFVEARLRVVRGEPDVIVDTAGMSDRVRKEADCLNRAGLQRYCQGHPDAGAFAAVATEAQQAQADTKFRRLLEHVTSRRCLPPESTSGA